MAVMTAADQSPPAATPMRREPICWERCLAEHESWLRRVIAARTAEPAAVDDVWQQVALAAVEQRWPLADSAKAAPWLHRLAVVASARYRRQRGCQRRATERLAREQNAGGNRASADPLALLLRRERHELTRQAMLRLAPRDAEILQLKYGERWSYRQIAEQLGLSERAVDSRLLRARAALRRELMALGIDEDER
jgi:RNA polymerase sigma-70 factor (ECF subfamily)